MNREKWHLILVRCRQVFSRFGTAAYAVGLIVTVASAAMAQGTGGIFTVPVSVITRKGDSANGLKRDDFQLFADNNDQKISLFLPADSPIGFGVILGGSTLAVSPGERGQRVLDALKALQNDGNPADQYFVKPFGFDGIDGAIRHGLGEAARSRNPRKVLLVILDANDNVGRPPVQSLDAFQKQDIPIYFVVIGDSPSGMASVFENLSKNTGGSVIYTNPFSIKDELDRLAAQLRSEYLLGFVSSNTPQDGKFHNLKVSVYADDNAKLNVRYRTRYFAQPAKKH